MTILQDLTQTQAQPQSMLEELEMLRAENLRLKTNQKPSGHIKVSEKGAVSVYGLGRFPVTLYQGQWAKLQAMMPQIEAFIEANRSRLSVKD